MSKVPPFFGHRLDPRDSVSVAADELTEFHTPRPPPTRASEVCLAAEGGAPAGFRGLSQDHELLSWEELFKASREAVLLIDAASEKIVDGNPAAAALLGMTPPALRGKRFDEAFDLANRPALRASILRAQTEGRASASGIRTFRGAEFKLTITSFQVRLRPHLIVNVTLNAPADAAYPVDFKPSAAFRAIDEASVGFLVTDSSFRVEYANRGFLALINLSSQLSVRGTALVRWLGLSPAQLITLGEQFSDRCAIDDLITTLQAERDAPRAVALSVVPVPDGPTPLWGFCVRELTRLH